MSMFSNTALMIGMIIAVVLIGAVLTTWRVHAGHQVESDHPRHP